MGLSDEDYARLLSLRTRLRLFLRWSEQQAASSGLTPAQHQLLLAIRGHGDARGPTVGELADYLLLQHHSVVGLLDRAVAAGLVTRVRDEDDRRVARLALTALGEERIEALSAQHLEELDRLALKLPHASRGLPAGRPRTTSTASRRSRRHRPSLARVYDRPEADEGTRVLVDRLWPRGVARDDAPVDMWMKDVAPSAELRTWYGHVPTRFKEFTRRYHRELAGSPGREALQQLRDLVAAGRVVLVTATKDVEHSAAAVLLAALDAG